MKLTCLLKEDAHVVAGFYGSLSYGSILEVQNIPSDKSVLDRRMLISTVVKTTNTCVKTHSYRHKYLLF